MAKVTQLEKSEPDFETRQVHLPTPAAVEEGSGLPGRNPKSSGPREGLILNKEVRVGAENTGTNYCSFQKSSPQHCILTDKGLHSGIRLFSQKYYE